MAARIVEILLLWRMLLHAEYRVKRVKNKTYIKKRKKGSRFGDNCHTAARKWIENQRSFPLSTYQNVWGALVFILKRRFSFIGVWQA